MPSLHLRRFYYQRAPHVLAAAIILPFFSIVAVGLRMLARRRQKQHLHADDWLVIVALVCSPVVFAILSRHRLISQILTLGAAASLISGTLTNANFVGRVAHISQALLCMQLDTQFQPPTLLSWPPGRTSRQSTEPSSLYQRYSRANVLAAQYLTLPLGRMGQLLDAYPCVGLH
jgi:hypothetical protein